MAISNSTKVVRSQPTPHRPSASRSNLYLSRHKSRRRLRMRIGAPDVGPVKVATSRVGIGMSPSAYGPALRPDELSVPTPRATEIQLDDAAWYIQRLRTRPAVASGALFCSDTFRDALDRAPLKSRVRDTILEMLRTADPFGRTSVSGRKLAERRGLREATICSHLEKAREAELLLSKRRYNNSSLHQLTWPGSELHPLPPGVTPVGGHTWTDGELAWWGSLDTDSPQPPPWADGRPPF